MRQLDRAVLNPQAGGDALPSVFPDFQRRGIEFVTAEVSMICGAPNVGKSPLALWHAVKWVTDHGLRGIYLSADSSVLAQAHRALAMVSFSITLTEAKRALEAREPDAVDRLHSTLNGLGWSFERDLSFDAIDEEMKAFKEAWGSWPDFVVIDNVSDVDGYAEDEWAALRRIMKGMVSLAGETGSAIIVLHHTSESAKELPCPPRSAIQGKIAQKPSLILTVGEPDGNRLPVCPVKNRYSDDHNRSGQSPTWLKFNPQNGHYIG